MLLILGDVVKIKPRYRDTCDSGMGIIVKIESFDGPGWIGYDYIVMMSDGSLTRITESCVQEIYSSGIILQTSGSIK